MSKVLVTLDYEELEYCAISGARRNIRAMQKDRKPRDNTKYSAQNWWQSNITGVIGEYAVAKSLGEHWQDLEADRGGFDVLSYQVRSTENTSPKLAARPNDDLNHIYILAQVYKSRVLIHGWATGYEIQQLGAQEHGTIRLHHDMLNDMSLLPHPTIYTAQVQEWERPDYQ
jgi:hypothetical protein